MCHYKEYNTSQSHTYSAEAHYKNLNNESCNFCVKDCKAQPLEITPNKPVI